MTPDSSPGFHYVLMREPWGVAVVVGVGGGRPHEIDMLFNPETLKLLSIVLDDVCGHVSDAEARTYVATRLLEAAGDGERSMEILKQVATLALLEIYARTYEDDAVDAMTQERDAPDQPVEPGRSAG